MKEIIINMADTQAFLTLVRAFPNSPICKPYKSNQDKITISIESHSKSGANDLSDFIDFITGKITFTEVEIEEKSEEEE